MTITMWFGKYLIQQDDDDSIWIGKEGGEGMRIPEEKLEQFLDELWQKEM